MRSQFVHLEGESMIPYHLTTQNPLQHLTNFSDIFKETKKSESLRLHDRWSILTFSESVVFGVIQGLM